MGTITQQNDRYAINARVVDVETGVQVASSAVSCGRSDELDRKYGSGTVVIDGPTIPPPLQQNVKILYVGSPDDLVRNEAVKDLLTAAGFVVDARPAFPDDLRPYGVVIYDQPGKPRGDDKQEAIGRALYSVAGQGRGVVLGGFASFAFGGWYQQMNNATPWVGCGEFTQRAWRGGTLQLARSRPFGVAGGVGTTIQQFAGDIECFTARPDRLEPSAQAVLQFVSEDKKQIGAYANVYGKGRVYFQYQTYHPNCQPLNDLFIAGVKWAARLVELDGGKGPG